MNTDLDGGLVDILQVVEDSVDGEVRADGR